MSREFPSYHQAEADLRNRIVKLAMAADDCLHAYRVETHSAFSLLDVVPS